MGNEKAYFVTTDVEAVYELSNSKKKQLEKKHPNWCSYNCDDNYYELKEVHNFFVTHGKLLAGLKSSNLFVGMTEG